MMDHLHGHHFSAMQDDGYQPDYPHMNLQSSGAFASYHHLGADVSSFNNNYYVSNISDHPVSSAHPDTNTQSSSINVSAVGKRHRSKALVRCEHKEQKHYSNGMCKKCYHKQYFMQRKNKQTSGSKDKPEE